MILDGSVVAYSGPPREGLVEGDQGHVLVSDESAAHVRWTTGSRTGMVDMVATNDLSEGRQSTVGDYLGSTLGYETDEEFLTPDDVVSNLMDDGEMDRIGLLAEDAVEWIGSRVRTMESIRTHASRQESEDDFYNAVIRSVLHEAVKNLEDDDA